MMGRAATNMRVSAILWLCAVTSAAVSTADSACQESAVSAKVANADTAAGSTAFEVASIKPNKSGGGRSSSGFNHGRFTATNAGIKTLLQYDAYGIPEGQIQGGPAWLSSDRFDIEAKVDDATAEKMGKLSRDERNNLDRQLIQQLLADRFKLVVHWETQQLPVYALIVAKNGPKLEKAKDASSTGVSSNNGKLTAKGVTMERLAQTLTSLTSRELGRFVIDKTGIEGRYDLALTWSPEDRSAAMVNASADNAAPPGPSIFTALQEQLGLKLESTKGPVERLVIDHIEQPSEN
jgi:uncharacterized protein (TIGR03435 family)